jgi:hypothetical protein
MTLTENEFDTNYTYNDTIISKEFDEESQAGMLETYGEDYQQVLAIHEVAPKTIWAMVDSEDGESMEIITGIQSSYAGTPIYYVITNEEWKSEEETYTIGLFE